MRLRFYKQKCYFELSYFFNSNSMKQRKYIGISFNLPLTANYGRHLCV